MTACKQKPNMVIAMVTYPYFIQPENNEETWLDNLEEKDTSFPSCRLLKSGQQSMIKIYRHWHTAIRQRHCRILSCSGSPLFFLARHRPAVNMSPACLSACVIVHKAAMVADVWDYHKVIRRRDESLLSRTSLIWLSLVYILILAPAWPLWLRVIHKTQ